MVDKILAYRTSLSDHGKLFHGKCYVPIFTFKKKDTRDTQKIVCAFQYSSTLLRMKISTFDFLVHMKLWCLYWETKYTFSTIDFWLHY